jgi:hypothetical protein
LYVDRALGNLRTHFLLFSYLEKGEEEGKCFTIVTKQRPLEFLASDSAQRDQWVAALKLLTGLP